MAATVLSIDTIVSDPNVRSGRPIIAGTSIRVMDIVASYVYRRFDPEELAVQFNLPLAQIYAALAYYLMHQQEIEQDLRQDAERAEKLIADLEQQGKVIRLE
jgi:uncharacterized protein (DUF433 family)